MGNETSKRELKLPEWTVVGFTGHRFLEDESIALRAIESTLAELTSRCGDLAAVSSAASGADTLFLEATTRRGLPLQLVLPFRRERFARDFSPDQWQRVQPMIEAAVDKTVIPDTDCDNEAYFEAGVLTVERCDILLAVWNGAPAEGFGGTADIVAYAEALDKPIITIDARDAAVSRKRLARLSSRTSPVKKHHGTPKAMVAAHFNKLDEQAEESGPAVRLLVLRMILLHLLASGIAIAGAVLAVTGGWAYTVASAKVAALGWALVLAASHHRKHHAWIDARPAAELCRSFLALWYLRRRGAMLPEPVLGAAPMLRRSLTILWQLDRQASLPLAQARERYLRERIDEQNRYFEREGISSERTNRWLRRLAISATWVAIAAGTGLIALMAVNAHGTAYYMAKLLSILLPLCTAALLSLVVAQDFGRRTVRYHDMQNRLAEARTRVAAARTWPSLWRAVADVENALLDEVSEWRSVQRFAGETH